MSRLCVALFILCGCTAPLLVRPIDDLTVNQSLQHDILDEADPIQAPATATIVADSVPVHSLPSLQSEIVHTLSEGNLYPISGRSSNGLWMSLSIDGQNDGWVSIRYLSVVGAITALEITETPKDAITSSWDIAVVTIEQDDDTSVQDRLHVRTAPDPYARVIGYVDSGDSYPVLSNSEDELWLQIPGSDIIPTDNPVGGWIASRFVQIQERIINPLLAPVEFTMSLPADEPTVTIRIPAEEQLLVRNAPRPDGEVLGYVSEGERYRILDESEQYSWILIEGGESDTHPYSGWVSGQYTILNHTPDLSQGPLYRPLVAYTSFSLLRNSQPLIQSGQPNFNLPAGAVSMRSFEETSPPLATQNLQPSLETLSKEMPSEETFSEEAPSESIDITTYASSIPPLKAAVRLQGNLLINVRYAPTIQSAIVGYIYSREPILIEGHSSDRQWYLVGGDSATANPHGGWVASHLVELPSGMIDEFGMATENTQRRNMRPNLTDFDATLFPYSNKFRYALVNTEGAPLRVRSEPNTTSKTLAFAQDGELYLIADYTENGQWIALQDSANRWQGWSAAEYLVLLE